MTRYERRFFYCRLNLFCSYTIARITCLEGKYVVKSAPLEFLRGELHFYRSIPPDLSHLFPKLVEANESPDADLPSITITKVLNKRIDS